MRRRHKVGFRKAKRLFHRTAKRIHRRNYRHAPMRGGIRL